MDQQNNAPEKIEKRLEPTEIPEAQIAPEADAAANLDAAAQADAAANMTEGEAGRLSVDAARYANPEVDDPILADDDDDAPTEWVPTRFEKRIKAIPEKQWKLYQTLAGIVVGALTAGALFLGGSGSNMLFLVAVVVALAGPNILEDRGRRKLGRFRMVLIIVMTVCIAVFAIYIGSTQGWSFFARKEKAEAALRMAGRYLA